MSWKRRVVLSLAALAALPVARAHAALPDGCLHPTWCPAPAADATRDLLDTALTLDVTALTGRATITIMPSMTSTGASFDVRGLAVRAVHGPLGPLQYAVTDGRLDVGVPLGLAEVTIDYDFERHDAQDGFSSKGASYTWPYYCGNLFPCKPETAEGQSYALTVTGVPAGQTAIYPAFIPAEAPAYMLALAVGPYVQLDLGTTPSGTRVSAWPKAGHEAGALTGTAHLVDAFAFYEQTLGVYVYGSHVGPVEANAGTGMEHHPFWHLDRSSMADELSQFHEAAHGWFGNGVRMACWEDFAFSEGSATYWSMRAKESIFGADSVASRWANEEAFYGFFQRFGIDSVLIPEGCNQTDVNEIYSSLTYTKGALFLRALETRVGRAAFDHAVSAFYMTHVGQASGFDALAETVGLVSGVDVRDLQELWLHGTVDLGEAPPWDDGLDAE
jgi:hypothetical protein